MKINSYKYSGMIIVDHNFSVPLDYEKDSSKKISIFVREIVRAEYENKELPYLIFFQGGPGYESPRPITDSGWIKRASEEFRVLLLDQRGTGLSTPISTESLFGMNDKDMANYLTWFRADNIVRDAEYIRENLIGNNKWSVLGQSFGGFCATHYLSFYPDSLDKVFITGGLPPLNAHPDDIYRSTYKRVIKKNKLFYQIFPEAKINARRIADYLLGNKVYLPNDDQLSVERFQQLGLNLGFSDGMATLNFLFEKAFINKKLSYSFLKGVLSIQSFDTNPIFTVLHEACYAQEFSTNWSAYRILDEYPEFIADKKDELFFTGEMLYPWMLDTYQSLQPLKGAAQILAEKSNWTILYNENALMKNKVPVAAAVYTNDMYIDRNYSMDLANIIPNIRIWETESFEHNGLRSNGKKVLDSLFMRIK
ncbi:MAG: alpha/beta fold hydrolase [Candidatus Neomarinimicrobiota bacterium]|nr:alpha/beta fold hydrolase [Candidatus Neomarinimicrobiota bacterium]